MKEECLNYYLIGRNISGLTQEQAAERIPCSVRMLYNYEHGVVEVSDDVVDRMAEVYGMPILAIWHMKHHTLLGKYLPDVIEPQTCGDMGMLVYMSVRELEQTMETVLKIIKDGIITEDEHTDLSVVSAALKMVAGRAMSAALFADAEIRKGAGEKAA